MNSMNLGSIEKPQMKRDFLYPGHNLLWAHIMMVQLGRWVPKWTCLLDKQSLLFPAVLEEKNTCTHVHREIPLHKCWCSWVIMEVETPLCIQKDLLH